jgi:creatine kinase
MYKKPIVSVCGALACSSILYKKWSDFNSKPINALSNTAKTKYPTSAEYPELNFNRNIMSKTLTEFLYAKLRDKKTPNGFTLDDAIQTGVDNVGKFTTPGIVAGDEESYKVFADLFDKIIEEKHLGYKKGQEHKTNLNVNDLKIDEPFDSNYVLSCRIKTIRNIRGFCFPTFCSRGERRDIETLLVKILYDYTDNRPFKYKGTYFPMSLVNDQEEDNLKKVINSTISQF